jgi:Ser/Thr protein kinase RdoA (MazF antagonist)
MTPDDLAATFAPHLGWDAASLQFLRYSQNFVFSYRDGDGERILRVTSDEHRSRSEIAAELEWIAHLHRAGASVCTPVQTANGILSATCGGALFHAVAFEKAPGRPVESGDLSAELSRAHGRTLAIIHQSSSDFRSDWAASRRSWEEERYFDRDISTYLPQEHQQALKAVFARLRAEVNSAPRTERTFGPVHFDLGYSNFWIEDGRLTVFDFDNCTAGYFLGDIAAALYGSIFTLVRCEFRGDRSAFEHPKSSAILKQILSPFREGYASVFDWPGDASTRLQPWLDLMYFRAVIHAYRISPVTNPQVQKALGADIENLLTGRTPVCVPGQG